MKRINFIKLIGGVFAIPFINIKNHVDSAPIELSECVLLAAEEDSRDLILGLSPHQTANTYTIPYVLRDDGFATAEFPVTKDIQGNRTIRIPYKWLKEKGIMK